ncbi:MAG: pyruvate kinase [Armatimonadetes bacterium]|nr:pyruvate kinase [Armatimonadota bacterium]
MKPTQLNRRTKIICTMGPATDSRETLRALIEAGLDCARLNFSHGEFSEHERRIRLLREAAQDAGRPIAILADLPGPKMRIGTIQNGTVQLRRGDPFTLTLREVPGDEREVHLPDKEVFEAVKKGNVLFLDDGLIEIRVEEVTPEEIHTQVVDGGPLSSNKGLVLPGVKLNIPSVTDEDREALRFIARQDIDWVAASFVRHADDVREIRKFLKSQGSMLPIIAKIEKHEAIECLDAILKASDALMVARGDLGVEMPIYRLPLLQKQIINRCNCMGKPVITATQMLDSMIRNPRPTRAEVSDVANAVLDGTDCVMLSGETAVGQYPVETVRMMSQVILQAESSFDYNGARWRDMSLQEDNITDAVSQATCDIARDLNASVILTSTSSGYTARMVSRHRPETPIIGITSNPQTYRRLALTWGVLPVLTPPAYNTDETLETAAQTALDQGIVKEGDLVVITAGVPTGVAGNTNMVKIHRIGTPVLDRTVPPE